MTPCSPAGPTPMPTTRSWEPARPSWRTRSRPPAPGISSARSRSPWKPYASPRRTRGSSTSRAVSGAASPCAASSCPSPICSSSMSRPTISMPSRWRGWSATCPSTPAPWWPSPTIATSSTMWPSGSSSSTGAGVSPSRATTARGWEQKQARLDSQERAQAARKRTLARELEWVRMAPKARQAKGRARLSAYENLRTRGRAVRPGRGEGADPHPARSAPGAIRSSRSTAYPRGSATASSSRTSRSRCPRLASSASSAATGRARPPCSTC